MEATKKNFKQQGIRYSKSLIFPYNLKEYKNHDEKENNIIINNNFLFNKDKDNSLKNLSEKNKKHLLIIQKINIKDKKNNFYKEGINNIFNDENLFFSDKYKNNKVVVGKNSTNKSSNEKLFPNVFKKKTLSNFNKKRFYKASTIKNFTFGKFRKDELSNSLRKRNGIEKNNFNDYPENINNYSISSLNSRFDHRKSLNLYGKRGNIFISNQNNISDNELNLIYKKFLDKEKENKQKEIKLLKLNIKNSINKKDVKDIKNNKIKEYQNKTLIKDIDNKLYNKFFKNTIDKEINSRLNLQQNILNKYQFMNKQNQKLLKKILKKTTKNSNDILLMNQLDNYRIKMEKIDEKQKMKKDNIYNRTIYWLSSLRNYPNKDINTGKNILNNINNSSLPIIYKNMRKSNQVKDDICDNYINNLHYSFGSNSNLYCDLESNISPLYAFILSDSLKSNEKIRNTHIDDYYTINNNICDNYNYKQLKKNISVPFLSNRFNLNDKNNTQGLKDLNVEGKKLIEQEMRISKQLEGKKKRLVKTVYNDDEIDNKNFAESYLLDYYNFPKAVKNTLELHNSKDN